MLCDDLLANDTIRRHDLTPDEVRLRIAEMMALVERHLADAESTAISNEARHNLAYAASRVAAEAVMLAAGYRPGRRMGKHAAVFLFLGAACDARWRAEARYFDTARRKRNESEYERTGTITQHETASVIAEATRFAGTVREWLKVSHPEFGADEPEARDTQ